MVHFKLFWKMLKIPKKPTLKSSRTGQNMIEYILVFVAVVVFLITTVGPGGMYSNKIEESLGNAVLGAKCMTAAICYELDPADCSPTPAGCP